MQFALIYAGFNVLKYFSSVQKSRENFTEAGWFSIPRWHEIDETTIAAYSEIGEHHKTPWKGRFEKVELRDGTYLLHTAGRQKQVEFIPQGAFEPGDLERFEAILARHGLPIVRK